jgi:ceramide glucosyltransferase
MHLSYQYLAAWLSFGCYVAAGLGCFFALGAAWLACRLAPVAARRSSDRAGVTMLKPLHGAEPGLYANLASFCVQHYSGPLQIIFGVQDALDPAIPVVRRLIDEFPDLDIDLVIDPRRRGANRKVANLVNMAAKIRHPILVLSDSDIRVEPDYLAEVLSWLQDPVGLVTCPYRGAPTSSRWAQLEAQMINHHFLPSVLVGVELGLARPCFGSTIALRASTLTLIGGFEAFLGQLADDYAIGEAVRDAGFKVVMCPQVVSHMCSEADARDLIRHELRWARTIRFVDPAGFVGAGVTHALPLALLGGLLGGFGPAGLVMISAALASRLILQMHIDDALGIRDTRFWWGPLRDLLSFAIFVASFFGNDVTWRGQRYNVREDGSLVYVGDIGS